MNLAKVLPRTAHVASAGNAVGNQQPEMIDPFEPRVDMGVPESGNEKPPCGVNYSSLLRDANGVEDADGRNPISRYQHSLVALGSASGRVNNSHVRKRENASVTLKRCLLS